MFGKIFSILGGAIGSSFGGGILSTIGRFAGNMLGTYLEQSQHKVEEHHRFKNVKDSFALSRAMYGEVIPLIFGTARVGGKIIWAQQIKEVRNNSTEKKYFKQFHQVKELHHTTECEYYLSFAVSICEGKIADVIRVWANDSLINLSDYKCRLYLGTEEQLPDSLIVASTGGQAPAFRGLSYIIFEELPLADFGSTVPNFSFEVIRKANIQAQSTVEDIVKSIVMIPGSGEFVYDTVVQHKRIGTNIAKKIINSHNYKNIANSVYSLNQLQIICENVEWIAPVACWFGDSTDAIDCIIKPAIEFNDQYVKYSEEWQVGRYSRSTAKEISKDEAGNPRYGGSVNDASIVRYLQELKRRNLKIMFYPMVFLDIQNKPWRGHLTGTAEAIVEFFNKEEGYNNFILHYAELVKDYVDAFVIGSELIGLTKVQNTVRQYPAVIELIKLAERVKAIVGSVLVTYAADWSEYHHTTGGWYNLDPLWASPYIDFIGIDAYFPVTRTTNSNISFEDMVAGWQTGEGFDYYTDNEIRYDLAPEYAWKNLRHWWENRHQNPDGMFTEWQPRLKQIWFTEFGFPSIDKATNQPNVFFDPNCVDGGVPRYSSGDIDFSIQRKAIKAFIEYWQSQEYIGQMFLWTWDARPYPAWPHMNIWRDGYLWEKGHWVNNKFGAASIAAIILELSERCGLNLNKIDVVTLDDIVEGVIFNRPMTITDAINILRVGYFFDITASAQDKPPIGGSLAFYISCQLLLSKVICKSLQIIRVKDGNNR
ncbi:baseplate megatron protein TIM-barrel domain-containing protein [Candidatus Trichorickettsia mobilis]|uniref:baseplate megatron protein TIM-barrel domain-containing protein n=1 Tax=Candidatus Trichorickettsia mobilis TaxID=1346319 RepID=UPI0029302BB0|nr:glycoside hydrolase TIM-barrel-like domain-containing protein [Candidatus Trichorickettsia mobilis]